MVATFALAALTPARAADQILSGVIKSSTGETMGGVTVSAKPEGGTVTTTVYTDETGNLLLSAPTIRQISGMGAGAELRDR